MYRRYYSCNDMPAVASGRNECCGKPAEKSDCESNTVALPPSCGEPVKEENGLLDGFIQNGKIFGKFELDDVLLLVVILVLLFDECDDSLLILALGFVFISGII